MKTIFFLSVFGVAAVAAVSRQDPPEFQAIYGEDHGLRVRGEGALVDGQIVVTLPAWFEKTAKTGTRTVQLTCKDEWSGLSTTDVVDGRFTVRAKDGGNKTQKFFWEVAGVFSN